VLLTCTGAQGMDQDYIWANLLAFLYSVSLIFVLFQHSQAFYHEKLLKVLTKNARYI
jgi:hypothetical protein